MGLFSKKPQPMSFLQKYQKEIKVREDNMVSSYASARNEKDLHKKILRLNEALSFFEEFKDWACKTPDGAAYFSQNWEHLHNSKCADFSYGERIKEDIAKCEKKLAK